MYTVVHETTFLDWGLTSEWALTTPGRTRQCAAAAAATATPSRSAVKDGNAASEGAVVSAFRACLAVKRSRNGQWGWPVALTRPEFRAGYGEVTAGSLQHVLNYLAHLRRRAQEAGGEEAAAGAWALLVTTPAAAPCAPALTPIPLLSRAADTPPRGRV